MRQSFRLGRIFGVTVGLDASVLVIAGLLVWALAVAELPLAAPDQPPAGYWLAALVGAVLFLASLLAHEIAHAVVARRHGVEVKGITLWMLGGVAELEGDLPTPSAALRVAAVGPAVSAALAVGFTGITVAAGLLGAPKLVGGLFGWLALVNGMLAVFNLLPGIPLDGGRVLRAVLWRRSGDPAGSAVRAARAGHALGLALIVVGIAEALFYSAVSGLWLAMIGWFVLGAADAEARTVTAQQVLRGLTVEDVMTPDAPVLPGSTVAQDVLDLQLWRTHADVCVVIDPEGRPEGLLALTQLAALEPVARGRLRLEDLVRQQDLQTADPDEAVLDAVRRLDSSPGLAVIDAAGHPVGVLTSRDVQRVVAMGPLVRHTPRLAR